MKISKFCLQIADWIIPAMTVPMIFGKIAMIIAHKRAQKIPQ